MASSSNMIASPSSAVIDAMQSSSSSGHRSQYGTNFVSDYDIAIYHGDVDHYSPTRRPSVDQYHGVETQPLTSSPLRDRNRLPPILPRHTPPFGTSPQVAISVPINTNTYIRRQDVLHSSVNSSATYPSTSTVTRHGYLHQSLESPLSSYTDHGSLNQSSPYLNNQVFQSTQDLAAHYGIPQILPPAPRTTPRRPSFPHTTSAVSDFTSLSDNYLKMLSQQYPESTPASGSSGSAVDDSDFVTSVNDETAARHICEAILASPEFASPFDMNDFMTSPLDDSPFPETLRTPQFGSDLDMLTSPLIAYGADNFDAPLFGDMSDFDIPPSKPVADSSAAFTGLYTMTPPTPALDPSSLYPSPRLPADRSSFPNARQSTPASRRKSSATGTRKNITPDSLIDLEAPTQPRKYVTPSATSKKEVPAVFARKRGHSQAFGEEQEEAEEPLPPNATEKEQIEWKRRQNTLAARKSRKRKLEHQQQLEDSVERLTKEKEVWKTRALTYQQMLRKQGIDTPDHND